jgi:DNA-3-methyladenine glycosylase II
MHRRALAHLRAADPVMAAIIMSVGACRFRRRADGTHFDSLLRAIVYQQLSGRAAGTIHARVDALLGASDRPQRLLALDHRSLRSAGLSRQKIAYLRDLAKRVHDGRLPLDALDALDDAAVIASLTAVHGIGDWTAQIFLMSRLGRPDVLPELDLGVRKAVQRAYRLRDLPDSRRLRAIAEPWRPFRSVASWYLWRSIDEKAAIPVPRSTSKAS